MLNQVQQFESIDSGSNYAFGDKMLFENQPRSKFDLTHLNTLTLPNAGLVIPIDWFETNPNEDFDISADCLLRVMPQVVPLYSRQRLYIYAFYSRCVDLWSGWEVHARKGYSGNVIKTRPVLDTDNLYDYHEKNVIADSLADYLDLPIGASGDSLAVAGLNAMIPFMYLRIWRDYFMNKNHFIDDRLLLPDDDSRFRLGDDGNVLSAKDLGKTVKYDMFGAWNDIRYITDQTEDDTLVVSGFYHDYPSDRFTSSLPFLQRGNAPNIDVSMTDNLGATSVSSLSYPDSIFAKYSDNVNADALIGAWWPGDQTILPKIGLLNNSYTDQTGMKITNAVDGANPVWGSAPLSTTGGNNYPLIDSRVGTDANDVLKRIFNSGSIETTTSLTGSISARLTVEALRKALVEQNELERMARTDGSYAQFGLTFFGEKSKATRDFKPYYIGGTYKNIAFTEVLQTGAKISDDTTPLGTMAGHGITGLSNARIGRLHSDDFGFVMILACIMPDIYYSQGIDKKWTKINQSELYLPERARLGLQPVYNKELYYAGNNGTSEGDDNYLWAYNNPFDEFRYTPNKIHGKIADTTNNSFFPYTQSRKFENLVNWGRSFSEANDVRKDYLAAANEDAYSAQFQINIRAVRPIPYKPVPAEILN